MIDTHDRWKALAAATILAAFLVLTVSTLKQTAPTFDEVAHLPAGYVALVSNQHHLNREHPPLSKKLAALPLLAKVDVTPEMEAAWNTMNEWDFGRYFLFEQAYEPQDLLLLGRLPMVGLGLLMCLVCMIWSGHAFGTTGALTTLLAASFSPLVIAHSRLVTTDVPLAAFAALSALLCWRWTERPGWGTAVALGLASGAACATKFTGLLFLPALALAATIALKGAGSSDGAPRRFTRARLGQVLVAGVAAVVVICGSYGSLEGLRQYLLGLSSMGFNHTPGYPFFLLGEYSSDGFPPYFPIAFFLKSSPAVLTMTFLLAAWPAVRRVTGAPPNRQSRRTIWPFIAIPGLTYALAVCLLAPDIGVRYLIPALPFLFVAFGLLGASLFRRRAGALLLALIGAVHVYSGARARQDPIAYFNGLLGCSGARAIRCLDDSNLDWGQNLGRISSGISDLRAQGEPISFLYFGTADPRAYLRYWSRMKPAELSEPLKRLYVVSVHALARLEYYQDVKWNGRYEPVAKIGSSYLVFDFRD